MKQSHSFRQKTEVRASGAGEGEEEQDLRISGDGASV
jgi:hypothetical protein